MSLKKCGLFCWLIAVLSACGDPVVNVSSPKLLAEITRDLKAHSGLMDLWCKNEEVLMRIRKDQLGTQFVFHTQITGGAGGDRFETVAGMWGWSRIVTFARNENQILINQEWSNIVADESSAQARGLRSQLMPISLGAFEIKWEDESSWVVAIGDFLRTFDQGYFSEFKKVEEWETSDERIMAVKAYPENIGFDIDVNFTSPKMARFTLRIHSGFFPLPNSDYVPRKSDRRLGVFTHTLHDLSREMHEYPLAEYMIRWNLKKKFPERRLSPVVKPITWWVSNNTPQYMREHVKNWILQWNKAFEVAGFLDAVEVKFQPDDADWDLGDIRYNVVHWATSPDSFLSGFAGPQIVHPQTGEILRGFVLVEGSISNGGRIYAPLVDQSTKETFCSHRKCLYPQLKVGQLKMAKALNLSPDVLKEMAIQFTGDTVMHETGHALGLTHNFRGSTMIPFEKIHDKVFALEHGTTGSIMDYNPLNIHPDPAKQGYFQSPTIGEYDKWVIRQIYGDQNSVAKDDSQENKSPRFSEVLDAHTAVWDSSDQPLKMYGLEIEVYEKAIANVSLASYPDVNDAYRRRNLFLTIIQKWHRVHGDVARFIGGAWPEIDSEILTGQNKWVKPELEAEALLILQRPFRDKRLLTTWHQLADDFPSGLLYDEKVDSYEVVTHYVTFVGKARESFLQRALSVDLLNRIEERQQRKVPGLSIEEYLKSWNGLLGKLDSRNHWDLLDLELFTDHLIALTSEEDLNRQVVALVQMILRDQFKAIGKIKDVSDLRRRAVLEDLELRLERHFAVVSP